MKKLIKMLKNGFNIMKIEKRLTGDIVGNEYLEKNKIMKNVFLLLIVVFVSCNGQTKNDLQKLNLRGKVKSMTEIEFNTIEKDAKFNTIGELDEYRREEKGITIFDEKGNEIEKNLYSYNLKRFDFVSKSDYDGEGKKITWKSYDNYGDFKYGDHFRYITKYSYDVKGNQIEEKKCKRYYNNNNPCIAERFYFDVDGNKIEGNKREGFVVLTDLLKNDYDEKGNKIEEKKFNTNGKLASVTKYDYDTRRNLIEEKSYYDDGIRDYMKKYVYDERNNLIESKLYYRDEKLIEVIKSVYDEKGNIIGLKSNSIYWANKYQNAVENADGYMLEYKFEYKFDENGNWIAQIKRGILWTEYRERYIEYYD